MEKGMKAPRVREVMTPRPVTIGPDALLPTASRLLREARIRHLPVVDDDQRLVGVITDRDVRAAAFTPALWEHLSPGMQARLERIRMAVERVTVGDLMTPDPVTATPETPLAEAAARMFEHRVGCLPVVEEGRLVGLLTETDALEVLAELLGPRGRLPFGPPL
jgi:acetoin utilization protein AcuB